MNTSHILLGALSLSTLTTYAATTGNNHSLNEQSPWLLRGGVAWRQLGGTSVNPKLESSASNANFFAPNPASGAENSNDNRNYDDGFVHIGAATAGTGLTTNFGFDADSQVVGDTLNFSLAGGSSISAPGKANKGDSTELAPYLELVYFRPTSNDIQFAFVSSLSYTDLDTSIHSSQTEYAITTVDSYNLNGAIPPQAPYAGSFAGPGVVIENQPSNRQQILTPVDSHSFEFQSQIDLYSLGFGSEIHWKVAPNCSLNFGGGLVINIADYRAKTKTQNTTGTDVHSTSDEEILFGLYLKAGAAYQITERISLEGFFRYDENEDLKKDVGTSSFKTDLSGWTTGLALGLRF